MSPPRALEPVFSTMNNAMRFESRIHASHSTSIVHIASFCSDYVVCSSVALVILVSQASDASRDMTKAREDRQAGALTSKPCYI